MALSVAALDYIKGVIGTPYGYWNTDNVPDEQPAWAKNGLPPSASYVKARTIFCAGVPNLMLRAAGWIIPHSGQSDLTIRARYDGGTAAYGNYYSNRGVKAAFNLANAKTYHGLLIGRDYVSPSNQGHVGIVLQWSQANLKWGYYSDSVDYVLEATANAGCNWTLRLADSHYYNNYQWSVLPDNWCPTKV